MAGNREWKGGLNSAGLESGPVAGFYEKSSSFGSRKDRTSWLTQQLVIAGEVSALGIIYISCDSSV
jgi:hypothetical protein